MEPFVRQQETGGPGLLHIETWERAYPGLSAGFTMRTGGVSSVPFDALNCGLHVFDAADDVVANRKLLAAALGVGLGDCTYGEQIHGCDVAALGTEHRGRGTTERDTEIKATDGFVTNLPNIYIHALFADCVPLYFFDPENRAIGLAHAGWKGTVLQIAERTVARMNTEYGTDPAKLLAAIGPSIGSCCYEVDETVAGRVRELYLAWERDGANSEDDRSLSLTPKENGKYMLDLQQLNRQIMIKAGIMPTRIEITTLCTSCHTDLFYSHRKEGGKTGRMAAWIGLREGDSAQSDRTAK